MTATTHWFLAGGAVLRALYGPKVDPVEVLHTDPAYLLLWIMLL